jgi:long-chain acyl-CoA synthetase
LFINLLESKLKESRFIEQIIIIGESEKMPAAIIQPYFKFLVEWANRKKLNYNNSNEELIKKRKVIKRIQKEIDKVNVSFGKWEQVKAFELTSEIWSEENRLLTPTLKMKRREILNKYKNLYLKIYNI